MSNGSADEQYCNTGNAPRNNPFVGMAPVAMCECEQADWHDDNQHLCVKVRFIELGKQWHGQDDDGQQQTVHKAQAR